MQVKRMPLTEKYRPADLSEVVGQDKAVALIRGIIDRGGFGGRAVWVSGASGTGKTTLARIIASELADGAGITEIVARGLSAAGVAELGRELWAYSLGRGGRALIINEAHGLSRPAIEALLDLLESIPDHACVIFTTTKEGQEALFDDHDDAGPLLSRCVKVPLTNQGLAKAFAERALTIARAENLDGQPIEAYVKLAQKCRNNFRAMLQDIDAGAMIGGAA